MNYFILRKFPNIFIKLLLLIVLYIINNQLFADTINDNLQVTDYIKTKFIPIQSYGESCFAGQQDNFLAFSDRRFIVAYTPAPSSGYLSYAFDASHNNVRWNSNTPIIIEIDFKGNVHYWRAFGVNFVYKRLARNITIEGYSTQDSTWKTIYNITNNNSICVVASTVEYSYISKLRFTISGIVNNNEIAIEEIWAYTAHTSYNYGGAYLRRDGGTIFGSVKIGLTASPKNLTVSGSIICPNDTSSITASSFKVGDWVIKEKNVPDYVFKEDYKLKPLQEVEQFTRENNHLPDVPSASQMIKEGVDLVEMNMTLLKKVEELTLYMIEQNKKIDKQQEELTELKKIISRSLQESD